MKTPDPRQRAISRRFLILGGIVLILAVLILLTSRNDDNRIFNVETVYDTVFVADATPSDSIQNKANTATHYKEIAHHRTSIPKNPWRGTAKSAAPQKNPLKPNPENCQAFATSISALFSPYYYKPINLPESQSSSSLAFSYEVNDSTYTFGVVCRWFSSCPDDGVEWCTADSLSQYGTSAPYPYFLVLGIGGSPESPETLYVLRAWTLRNSLTPNFLAKAHRKTPGRKFYYKPSGPWLN